MATMQEVREALAKRIEPLLDTDWTVYAFVPDAINAPAIYIDPDRPFINYQESFRSGQACWKFALTVLVNRIDDESAQGEISPMIDPEGPLVTGLQNQDRAIESDALDELAAYVEVLEATRYGAYRIGRVSYYGIQIMIEVRT
jgi:hypothetical protein